MRTTLDDMWIGFTKSIIPLFGIVLIIQYNNSTKFYLQLLGIAIFMLGYVINECVFSEESE